MRRSWRADQPPPTVARAPRACRTAPAASARCWAAARRAAASQRDPAHSVLFAFTNVQAEEHPETAIHPPCRSFVAGGHRSGIERRHPRLRRDLPSGRPCPYQRSLDATRPGDTTPRIMPATGGVSHAEPGDHSPLIKSYEEVTGRAPGPRPRRDRHPIRATAPRRRRRARHDPRSDGRIGAAAAGLRTSRGVLTPSVSYSAVPASEDHGARDERILDIQHILGRKREKRRCGNIAIVMFASMAQPTN
jgi:hypothetical protein